MATPTTTEPTLTFETIYNDLTQLMSAELTKYKAELLAAAAGMELNPALGRQEADYHIKNRVPDSELLAKRPVHELLPATHKLLTDRTLDMLYENIINKYMIINPVHMDLINKYILAPGLNHWLKYTVYSSKPVADILMPVVLELDAYVQREIARLDKIPYVEQKTQEWLAIRNNMISASVSGYYDAAECGCGMSKEYNQIKEKGGIQEGKKLSWSVGSIRHGMTFEDLSGALYNIFNKVSSKEYGILPDQVHKTIGASPDGIIIDVANRDSWLNLRKMGRMREIKNPTDRLINEKVPNYYYWQMVQQMYVCRLPLCDFIQTSFIYPNTSSPEKFIQDTLDTSSLETTVSNWTQLNRLFKPVSASGDDIYYANSTDTSLVLEKLDWGSINGLLDAAGCWMSTQLDELNGLITATVIKNWAKVSSIPMENINKTGDIKGVLWCFTKADSIGGTDFEVLFMPPEVPINSVDEIKAYYATHSPAIIKSGFSLETTYYWSCKKYLDFEVEYNQAMYDAALIRLLEKWKLVCQLRDIPDMETKLQVYYEAYPADNPLNKKVRASASSTSSLNGEDESKKAWGYTKRIKNPAKVNEYPELDLS